MTDLSEEEQRAGFDAVKRVVANDVKFKARLGIGDDAYTSLKVVKGFRNLLDVSGAAASGAAAAKSSLVATTFFGKTGFAAVWAALPLTAQVTTPIVVVAAAAVATGGACYGVARLFRGYSQSRVDTVPRFLNTPLDLLGTSILDLMGALSLKVAAIDGHVDTREVQVVRDYFVEDWGYDPDYVDHALAVLSANDDKSRLTDMTRALAEFVHGNPDCKFGILQQEIKRLLTEVAEADGRLDEREEMAIDRVIRSLDEQNSVVASLSRVAKRTSAAVSSATGWIGSKLGRNGKADQ
ncbi:TerB family tellurite resistance protein [Paracoccus sp. P2]|uniref:TerB family tellurite resistance protein n=1 Tax=unclassified Paracoccus (in: a-proteobacteria) TaxID=2688777 RepID=UPI000225FA10|nr:TerB family tellurite resistance protein [Paracoccus sp. TRP]